MVKLLPVLLGSDTFDVGGLLPVKAPTAKSSCGPKRSTPGLTTFLVGSTMDTGGGAATGVVRSGGGAACCGV